MGRRKTISGSWLLQIVDKAEEMIKVAFIDSFNHRKAANAVRNWYAEHFLYQMWQYVSDNDLNVYCSYSGIVQVVI